MLISDRRLSNGATVGLEHDFRKVWNQEDENYGVAFVGLSEDRGVDARNDTTLRIGLLGDRLALTSVHSISRYRTAEPGGEVVTGQGFFHSLDADLLRSEAGGLSVSGSYGIADDGYRLSEVDDDGESVIAAALRPGTEMMDYGLAAEFGLEFADLILSHDRSWQTEDTEDDYEHVVSSEYQLGLGFDQFELTLAHNTTVDTDGRGAGREREASVEYEAELEYQVQALRGLVGDPFGEAFWTYAPGSISLSYGIERNEDSDGGRAETRELGLEADWDWGGAYASLGYTYAFQEDLSYDSSGNDSRNVEYEAGGGLSGGIWSLDADLTVSQSVGLGQWMESDEFEIEPSLELSFKPRHWPDLSLSGSTSYFRGEYASNGETNESQSWEILTELDFAKFWPNALNSEGESMMLVFQLEGDRSEEDRGAYESSHSSLYYFVGFKLGLTLGR